MERPLYNRPCPFCGNASVTVGQSQNYIFVYCPKCRARGPSVKNGDPWQEWNVPRHDEQYLWCYQTIADILGKRQDLSDGEKMELNAAKSAIERIAIGKYSEKVE